ncbi:hypothetical protein Tco_1321258 [Tanacetum coccineum]
MDRLDKHSTNKANLLKALNEVTKTLNVIQDVVKEDPTLNKKVLEATKAYIAHSNNIFELLSLAKNFDLSSLKSLVETVKADTKEPSSNTEGEHVAMKDDTKNPKSDKTEEEPTNAKIATDDVESLVKLVYASKVVQEDPDEPIRVPYMINGKMYHLTNDEINEQLEKEDKIKKATEEAKRLEMTKTEVIKIVQEKAKKIGIDPKKIISAKAGEKFKKAQDAKMQVLKIKHSQNVKRLVELNKKRAE